MDLTEDGLRPLSGVFSFFGIINEDSVVAVQWTVMCTADMHSAKFTVITTGGEWCRIVMELASIRHSCGLCSD